MTTERDTIYSRMLNSTECLQIVRNSLGYSENIVINLINYYIERGSKELLGFMGEYYNLNICIEDKSSEKGIKLLRYFVKTVPISNEYHKKECERKGFFIKEVNIYRHILTNVQRYVSTKLYPKCYFTRDDLIVLEDLADSTEDGSLRHVAAGEGYSQQHHQLMLRHLAHLHAGSIAWEQDENFNIGEKFNAFLFEIQLTIRNECVIFLAKQHPKYKTPHAQRFIHEKLFEILCDAEKLTEPSSQMRNVLCHRDSWSRNIFYKYNSIGQPVDCQIVDFQLTRYSPPGIDILFFVYVTTNKDQRDRFLNDYLNYYYEAFHEALKSNNLPEDSITREELLEDCKRVRLAVLILIAICEPLFKLPIGLANKMRAEEAERFDYYMNCKREELFEHVASVDVNYKDSILAPIEELMDYLLLREENRAE